MNSRSPVFQASTDGPTRASYPSGGRVSWRRRRNLAGRRRGGLRDVMGAILPHSSTGTGAPHVELAALCADEVPRAGGLAIRACHPAARQSGGDSQESLRRILGSDSFLRSKFVSTLYATGVHLNHPISMSAIPITVELKSFRCH